MRRFRPLLLCSTLLALGAAALPAQQAPSVEIGAQLGLRSAEMRGSRFTAVSSSEQTYPLPPGPNLYATFFTSSRVAFEPQVGFQHVRTDGESGSLLSAAAQANYFLADPADDAPYVAASALLLSAFEEDDTHTGLGAGAGWRWVVRRSLGVRLEARYRHWFTGGDSVDEIGVALGFGAILPRSE